MDKIINKEKEIKEIDETKYIILKLKDNKNDNSNVHFYKKYEYCNNQPSIHTHQYSKFCDIMDMLLNIS
jgi:hypothetical protein